MDPRPEFCGKDPETGDLGITGAKIFDPGSPETSILYARISRNDIHQMPPIGSFQLHEQAGVVIKEWIQSISSCD